MSSLDVVAQLIGKILVANDERFVTFCTQHFNSSMPKHPFGTHPSNNPSTRFLIFPETLARGVFSGILIRQLKQTAIVSYSVCPPFDIPVTLVQIPANPFPAR